jgi:hypothetical protein
MKQTIQTKCFPAATMLVAFLSAPGLFAQINPMTPPSDTEKLIRVGAQPASVFDAVADQALLAMKGRAEELKIKGVAVVAYVPGDNVKSWISKMAVVGSLTAGGSQKDPGVNLLAIAYSKAAEMADTLKDSGSGVRPPMKGEFGWQGGLITKGKTGYVIAAFSGGPSESDVKVSRAGLELLAGKL